MEINHYRALSWIPWKKLNNIMPIRKSQVRDSSKHRDQKAPVDSEKISLPKLNVKKICTNTSRLKSPRRIGKVSKFTKTFSPVLTRGKTSEFSRRDENNKV